MSGCFTLAGCFSPTPSAPSAAPSSAAPRPPPLCEAFAHLGLSHTLRAASAVEAAIGAGFETTDGFVGTERSVPLLTQLN